MPFVIQKSGQCPASRPYAVLTETAHGSGKTRGRPHGCFPTEAAAREQQKALYVSVPDARSAAPRPPNLHEAEPGAAERCGSCKMFDSEKSVCWGYGNAHVKAHEVCDSYSPETAGGARSGQPEELLMTATASPPETTGLPADRAEALSESQRKRPETRQTHEPLELREGTEPGKRTLRSYASLFDEPYTVRASGYKFEEIIRPGAFKRTLGANPDVVFRTEHGGPPLAATWSGDLRLGEDEKGFWYEVSLDETDPDVRSLISKVERGVYRESSFAFRIPPNGDKWNEAHNRREVLTANLDRGDVSVVTFGASRETAKHMVLRSEEALAALEEIGRDQFVEAWKEYRTYIALSDEERAGRVVSSQSAETLRRVLGLIADADDAADEAHSMLADFLGVSSDENGNENLNGKGKLTSSEQLGQLGRSEERGVESPLDGDHVRTAPHLLDTVLNNLAHATQHMERLSDDDVLTSEDGAKFNVEHLSNHVADAQEHAMKLDNHLREHPTDPEVFRAERDRLSAQRSEEERDDGDGDEADDAVTVALIKARDALHDAMAAQAADPDAETDPNDAKVHSHLEDAKNALDEAIVDQAMDEAYENSEDGPDLYDESEDRKALTAKARNDLPSTAFVFPQDRRYPIQDVAHARNALARASGKPEEAAVKRAVYKRYPELRPGDERAELLPNDSEDLIFDLRLRGAR